MNREPIPYFIWYHREGTLNVDYYDEETFPQHPTGTDCPWLFDDLEKAKATAAFIAAKPGIICVGLDRMLKEWWDASIAMRMPRDPKSGFIAKADRQRITVFLDGKCHHIAQCRQNLRRLRIPALLPASPC